MTERPYRQAFGRIRAEYLEMPGMRLTLEQVQRLSGVDISICRLVLEDLVRAARSTEVRHGSPVAKDRWKVARVERSRRAS